MLKIPYEKIIDENYIGKEINPIDSQNIFKLAFEYSKEINYENGNINLLIIDAQRDFIDIEKGALPVKGAIEDIKRIIRFIYNNIESISDIYITLDTHKYDSIFHSIMWKDKNNNLIKPFTEITFDKIKNNEIMPIYNEDIQIEYIKSLEKQGSKNLIIWPYHCIYGTDGWLIEKQLSNMLLFFEVYRKKHINKILKGEYSFSEMYGVLRPEVINDNAKNYDISWIYNLKSSDKIYICGEAKDFCVYESVKQLCDVYDSNVANTIHVMMNCCSTIGDEYECNNKYKLLSNKYGIKLINVWIITFINWQ